MQDSGSSNKLLTSDTIAEGDHLTQDHAASFIGEPARKRHFEYVHLSAAAVSLLCLLVGVLTITPSLKIAWSLRFSGQIIVLGFLLGIMNLCMQTVVPHSFLLPRGSLWPIEVTEL